MYLWQLLFILEKGTESVKWVDSSLIEKTNEFNQEVEKVKRDIIKEEERINHQHDQLKILLDTAHDALEVPTGMISRNVISQ